MLKKLFAISLLTLSANTVSIAAEAPKTNSDQGMKPQVSMETRQKMASLHEKMAACLRSDKTVAECRNEMRDSCHAMLGKDGCPMMRSMWSTGAVGGVKGMHNEMSRPEEE